jgi:hypothetical protein
MPDGLIPMPTTWRPTHLFVLSCGHTAWVIWPDAPDQIMEGQVSCNMCDGGQTVSLEKCWRVP